MSNVRLVKAIRDDLERIRVFYWNVMDRSEKLAEILRWEKNVYPSDFDWQTYINKEEMYFVYESNRLVGAVALTTAQSAEYRQIDWLVAATDDEVLVMHLLAIDPMQQGRGLATAVLDEIVKLAKDIGKKAIRLDAIETNVPAQCLYEKYGFRNCGWAQAYYESVGLAGFYFYEYNINER